MDIENEEMKQIMNPTSTKVLQYERLVLPKQYEDMYLAEEEKRKQKLLEFDLEQKRIAAEKELARQQQLQSEAASSMEWQTFQLLRRQQSEDEKWSCR